MEFGWYSPLAQPLSDWRIVEINPPPPGADPKAGYVVIRHEPTGKDAVLWVAGGPAPLPSTRPTTRPVPPWPGIACIEIGPNPRHEGNPRVMYARLVGGDYCADNVLGWFHAGEILPKPWDRWRVDEVVFDSNRRPPPHALTYVVLRNEDSGRLVTVWMKLAGLSPSPKRPF